MSLVAIAKCLYCEAIYYADTRRVLPPIVECQCANEAVARVQRLEANILANKDVIVKEAKEAEEKP